ncbi:hypothetical protein GY45DRAFT_1255183 [Cubamyces sp. BRFM 1775]|nr:hypothetical protein GY45DRAFT_1255183 [Cubamyces sp. BRFM 1775]
MFHTAAIWRWNSDLETGNFVPPDAEVPAKLAEARITPGSLCQFSYAIDTQRDKSVWAAQKAFEDYVQGVDGFNRSHKPRRPWQDGNEAYSHVYVLSAQMFFKRTRYTSRKEASVSYTLHPWIEEVRSKTPYFPNPDRPRLFEPHGNVLRALEESELPHLKTGDLVWISFYVEFIIGVNNWSTTFTPCEVVRVGRVAADLVGDMTPTEDGEDEPRGMLKAGDKFSFGMCCFSVPHNLY